MASNKPVQVNAWRIKPSERRFLLFLVDLIVTVASLILAMYIWSRADPRFTFNWEFVLNQPPTWYFFLPVLWLLLLSELYDNRRSNRLSEVLTGIGMAVAVLHSESVQDIPLALSYSFGRGLLPFAVGSYLLLARARPAWLALGLAAVVFALALLDLLRMYPLINLWDVQSTMGFYGVRLASDLLIVHAVALRLVQFKVKGQPP